jgi:hypothetical protein
MMRANPLPYSRPMPYPRIPVMPAKAVAWGQKRRQILVIPALPSSYPRSLRHTLAPFVIPAKAGIQGEKPFFRFYCKGTGCLG